MLETIDRLLNAESVCHWRYWGWHQIHSMQCSQHHCWKSCCRFKGHIIGHFHHLPTWHHHTWRTWWKWPMIAMMYYTSNISKNRQMYVPEASLTHACCCQFIDVWVARSAHVQLSFGRHKLQKSYNQRRDLPPKSQTLHPPSQPHLENIWKKKHHIFSMSHWFLMFHVCRRISCFGLQCQSREWLANQHNVKQIRRGPILCKCLHNWCWRPHSSKCGETLQ